MKALELNEHDAVSGGIAPFIRWHPPVFRLPVEPPTSTASGFDPPPAS